jgi:hypothetical protein
MNRVWPIALVLCSSTLLLAIVLSGTLGASAIGESASSQNFAARTEVCAPSYFDSFTFGVDDWITSAPSSTILAVMTFQTQTYPALVATHYGLGKAVYAPGSLFSEIDNVIEPHNVRQEVFLNAVKWVTNDKPPVQTTVLVPYGHRELLTYGYGDCCSTNIIEALRDKGYTVVITTDIPIALSHYDAVIMSGVGWYLSPNYPNPLYWSGDSGHAPTPAEVISLLDFVQNGGGLVASVEFSYGADWMRPIGTAMSVTFNAVDEAEGLTGTRIIDHPILVKPCYYYIYLPVLQR